VRAEAWPASAPAEQTDHRALALRVLEQARQAPEQARLAWAAQQTDRQALAPVLAPQGQELLGPQALGPQALGPQALGPVQRAWAARRTDRPEKELPALGPERLAQGQASPALAARQMDHREPQGVLEPARERLVELGREPEEHQTGQPAREQVQRAAERRRGQQAREPVLAKEGGLAQPVLGRVAEFRMDQLVQAQRELVREQQVPALEPECRTGRRALEPEQRARALGEERRTGQQALVLEREPPARVLGLLAPEFRMDRPAQVLPELVQVQQVPALEPECPTGPQAPEPEQLALVPARAAEFQTDRRVQELPELVQQVPALEAELRMDQPVLERPALVPVQQAPALEAERRMGRQAQVPEQPVQEPALECRVDLRPA